MNLLNTFAEARKYFEAMAAYNIDRFRFQSMVSTAHKLLSIHHYVKNGTVPNELAAGIASISEYWYYKTLHSPLFKDHVGAFEYVKSWSEAHGMAFNTEADSFHTDDFCKYLLVKNPHSGGYEIFSLEDGESFVADTHAAGRNLLPATLTSIRGAMTPVYNFTRRECSARSAVHIGHQVAH